MDLNSLFHGQWNAYWVLHIINAIVILSKRILVSTARSRLQPLCSSCVVYLLSLCDYFRLVQ